MTAQERKDCCRVHASRERWKKRAVRRGEDRRRFRERRHAVDRSRQGWRDRALAAEQRVEQLEGANHQRQSALTRAPAPSTSDHTHFLSSWPLHLGFNGALAFRASRTGLRALLLGGTRLLSWVPPGTTRMGWA